MSDVVERTEVLQPEPAHGGLLEQGGCQVA
jgi:hypothetical protein